MLRTAVDMYGIVSALQPKGKRAGGFGRYVGTFVVIRVPKGTSRLDASKGDAAHGDGAAFARHRIAHLHHQPVAGEHGAGAHASRARIPMRIARARNVHRPFRLTQE